MSEIVVLGAGRVGRAIIRDLSQGYTVRAVDIENERLDKLPAWDRLERVKADISDKESLAEQVGEARLVIGALPGHLGYSVLENLIALGKDAVDISFFPEDPFTLEEKAREKGVSIIVDGGVAPGLSNFILGYHHGAMEVKAFRCYVGGLPTVRHWPFEYKAPFSPLDVLEEYSRPARIKTGGEILSKPALSDLEYIEFEEIGTLEAFLTDGLRTLLKTVDIPEMVEKTLRYPGHRKKMRILKEGGFLDHTPREIKGVEISPIEMTAAILFDQWELGEEEKEFTLMEVQIEGVQEGNEIRFHYHLYDEWDPVTKLSSMARTTGYTCTGLARILLEKKYTKSGIIPPEILGRDKELYTFLMEHLKERNIEVRHWQDELNNKEKKQ